MVISCEMHLNLDYLLVKLWDYLSLLRVYTKRRGGVSLCLSAYVCPYQILSVCVCPCVHLYVCGYTYMYIREKKRVREREREREREGGRMESRTGKERERE